MDVRLLETLWSVQGVDKIVGTPEEVGREYVRLVKNADEHLQKKQAANSEALDQASTRISDCEDKVKDLKEKLKEAEQQVKNLKAQITAETKKMEDIEEYDKKPLREDAVRLTDELHVIKELRQALNKTVNLPMEDRFFGKNGDGTQGNLRYIHELNSVADLNNVKRNKRCAHLSFDCFNGAETMELWVDKWTNPPLGMSQEDWTGIAGQKAGAILRNHAVDRERLGDIMLHLYDLSPVLSPVRKPRSHSKRPLSRGRSLRRSTSLGRETSPSPSRSPSRSRSQSHPRKKRRLESLGVDDILAAAADLLAAAAEVRASEEELE